MTKVNRNLRVYKDPKKKTMKEFISASVELYIYTEVERIEVI